MSVAIGTTTTDKIDVVYDRAECVCYICTFWNEYYSATTIML